MKYNEQRSVLLQATCALDDVRGVLSNVPLNPKVPQKVSH
jgi:hypothetical protein